MNQYLTSPQVAELLDVDRTTIARLIRQGKLPAIKMANRWFVEKTKVLEFAETYFGRPGRPKGWSPGTRRR